MALEHEAAGRTIAPRDPRFLFTRGRWLIDLALLALAIVLAKVAGSTESPASGWTRDATSTPRLRSPMDSNSIMQPRHPRWREFLSRLDAVPRCQKTTEHTRAILTSMDGVDVDRSRVVLHDLGGHCDCAILFDLEPAFGLTAS